MLFRYVEKQPSVSSANSRAVGCLIRIFILFIANLGRFFQLKHYLSDYSWFWLLI